MICGCDCRTRSDNRWQCGTWWRSGPVALLILLFWMCQIVSDGFLLLGKHSKIENVVLDVCDTFLGVDRIVPLQWFDNDIVYMPFTMGYVLTPVLFAFCPMTSLKQMRVSGLLLKQGTYIPLLFHDSYTHCFALPVLP